MISWIEIALALLKLANGLISYARSRELISEGQDQEIARQSAEILVKSQFAKGVMERVSGKSEAETDDILKHLGSS